MSESTDQRRNPIDFDMDYALEYGAAMCPEEPDEDVDERIYFCDGDSCPGLSYPNHPEVPHPPHCSALTIAVRVCGTCQKFLGVAEWRGLDAHPGETWCETAGLCPDCFDGMVKEIK